MIQSVFLKSVVENKAKKVDADRVGVFLSILCAIHCAVTPFLLIMAPAFGKMWSHPASHWGMALFVVPIAFFMVKSGYKKHGKKWILASGATGIILVLIGSVLPYMESYPETVKAQPTIVESETDGELVFDITTTELDLKSAEGGSAISTTGCVDNCCPSLITDSDGNVKLSIPPASIVTTLGGVALILTHLGNIFCCSCCCRRRKK